MLSVIIPADGDDRAVLATLAALVPGAAAGLIREVLLVDRSGTDAIDRVADLAGCQYIPVQGSHAEALATGARQARSEWLMFLHPGAVLDSGWIEETSQFIASVSASGRQRAGIFRYAPSPYGDASLRAVAERITRIVSRRFVDQGLIIARAHYDRLGGYSPNARRSEAKFLSHLGRSGRALLRTKIFVPAAAEA